MPLEHFLICPPRRVNIESLNLSTRGARLMLRSDFDVWDIWDYVGKQHYPYVPDFVEEGRRYGFSRRLSKTLDFSRLTRDSRQIIIHPRGYIDCGYEYLLSHNDQRLADLSTLTPWPSVCPQNFDEHNSRDPIDGPHPEMCHSMYYEAIKPDPDTETTTEQPLFYRTRRRSSYIHYDHFVTPEGAEFDWHTAIVMWLPISNIEVIEADDGSHEKTYQRVKDQTELPCVVQEA
jgi:hypothetical protein